MYDKVIPLTRNAHGNKRFRPLPDYSFASGQTLIPFAASEITHLTARLPLAFMEAGDAGLRPMALLGLDGKNNLLVDANGRWLQDYVPAAIRRYPFLLARNEQSEGDAANQATVAIDEAADCLSDSEGEPLFTEEGEPGERLQGIIKLLQDFDGGLQTATRAARRLAEVGVLEDWSPRVEVGDKRWQLKGLQRVNEEALNKLDAETFAGLRQGGALAIAYAQMLSMSQLARLVRAARQRQGAAESGNGNSNPGRDMTFDFNS